MKERGELCTQRNYKNTCVLIYPTTPRGHLWLYSALIKQSLESYVRMYTCNVQHAQVNTCMCVQACICTEVPINIQDGETEGNVCRARKGKGVRGRESDTSVIYDDLHLHLHSPWPPLSPHPSPGHQLPLRPVAEQ